MKVILNQAVKGLGRPGDAVEVAPGYARNYLIPRGFADVASDSKAKEWEFRRAKVEHKITEERAGAEELAGKLSGKTVTIKARAGEEGKLFGSVTNKDIADAVQDQLGIELDRRKIDLAEPIRTVGEHKVPVDLHPDVVGEVSVEITSTVEAV